MRRLILCCVVLAASGCGGDKDPASKQDATKDLLDRIDTRPRKVEGGQDKLRQLLADRSRALAAGDGAALAATASGAQKARDGRTAARTRRLDIERAHYGADELQTSGDGARIAATLSYLMRGTERPFSVKRRIEARRTADGWRITRDAPRREQAPWEVAPFSSTRSRHIVLLTADGVDPAQLRPRLERAYRDIERDLPRHELPRSVVVIATADAGQAERLNGPIGSGIDALANVVVIRGPAPARPVKRVLAQRMIVIVSRWGSRPEAERQQVLVHEMTHTALNPDSSGRTPAWLVEGVAMYVAGQDRTAEARAGAGAPLAPLSKPGSIFHLPAGAQRAAYVASSAAAHAIARRRGSKALFALFDRFNDNDIPGRPGARTTERVLHRTLGMSLAALDAAAAGR